MVFFSLNFFWKVRSTDYKIVGPSFHENGSKLLITSSVKQKSLRSVIKYYTSFSTNLQRSVLMDYWYKYNVFEFL